ncbi:MAG: hypothetical protein DWH86_01065 [Planctomycetota bacterium]|nr:MAG: hypothetical protein DWH86_01065 [Planctomycetota bacterium]
MNYSSPICFALGLTLGVAGCETVSKETSDGRPMPPHARVPQTAPEGVPINAISALYAPKPTDGDANGRPDRLSIELYLFARPYPTPVWREGTLNVAAYRMGTAGSPSAPGDHPIHVWSIPTRDLDLGRFRSLIGEGYRFQVSLLDDGGNDHIDGTALDFVTWFRPASGAAPIWSDGVRSIAFEPMASGEVR